jgi:hypothetical protein
MDANGREYKNNKNAFVIISVNSRIFAVKIPFAVSFLYSLFLNLPLHIFNQSACIDQLLHKRREWYGFVRMTIR